MRRGGGLLQLWLGAAEGCRPPLRASERRPSASKSARSDVEVMGSDRMKLRGCEALDATER